jgi:hypothetical protein
MTKRALTRIMTGWCRMAACTVGVSSVIKGYIAP